MPTTKVFLVLGYVELYTLLHKVWVYLVHTVYDSISQP